MWCAWPLVNENESMGCRPSGATRWCDRPAHIYAGTRSESSAAIGTAAGEKKPRLVGGVQSLEIAPC